MTKPESYSKIMVLGTAANHEGELCFSPPAKCRCDRAAKAYFASGFNRTEASILIAGGYGGWLFDAPPIKREAVVMADYLIKKCNVPLRALLLEDESTTTEENFTFSQEIHPDFFDSVRNTDGKLAIVSHESHLEKALAVGGKVLHFFNGELVSLPASPDDRFIISRR